MTAMRSLVSVDDDESVRESRPDLLHEQGFAVRAFAFAEAFLESEIVDETRCLIVDVAIPGMSGLDLQLELARQGHAVPIVLITAQHDQKLRPRVIARGAVECLFKPFSETTLFEAVKTAIRRA